LNKEAVYTFEELHFADPNVKATATVERYVLEAEKRSYFGINGDTPTRSNYPAHGKKNGEVQVVKPKLVYTYGGLFEPAVTNETDFKDAYYLYELPDCGALVKVYQYSITENYGTLTHRSGIIVQEVLPKL
jgi:hypothetical protein